MDGLRKQADRLQGQKDQQHGNRDRDRVMDQLTLATLFRCHSLEMVDLALVGDRNDIRLSRLIAPLAVGKQDLVGADLMRKADRIRNVESGR